MRTLSFYICFFFLCNILFAQGDNNSREKTLEEINENYLKYHKHYYLYPDSALYYAEKLYKLSRTLNDDLWLGVSYYSLGASRYMSNNKNTALAYFNKSLEYATKTGNDSLVHKSYNALGEIEAERGNYDNAITNYKKALGTKNIKNHIEHYFTINYNIASSYIEVNNVKEAKKYIDILNGLKKNNREVKFPLIEGYYNIGLAYVDVEKDSALLYLNKSLALAKEYGDIYFQIYALNELAQLDFRENKNSKEGFNKLKEAERLSESSIPKPLGITYKSLGKYYQNQNNRNKALAYYEKSRTFLKEDNDRLLIYVELLESMEELYRKNNNYSKAFQYLEELDDLKDRISLEKDSDKIQELQVRYDIAKKNSQIEQLHQEQKINKTQKRWLLITGLILLITLGIILFTLNKRLRAEKALRIKEQEQIKQEREIKKIIGVVEGQELERLRIAKELHDGISMKLAILKLSLSLIKEKESQVEKSVEEIGSVMQEVRIISQNLSSYYLAGNDFDASLKHLFLEVKKTKTIDIDVSIHPEGLLDNIDTSSKHHIYRIFQELLMNVLQHSQASQVDVSILEDEENYNFMFIDNGIGIENINKIKKVGLENVEKRINSMRGELTIDTELNIGTTITFNIPKG